MTTYNCFKFFTADFRVLYRPLILHMLVVFVHRTFVNACNFTIQLKPLCPGQ